LAAACRARGIVPAGKYKPTDFYTNEFNPHAKDTASAK
jgi:hypothetical protein